MAEERCEVKTYEINMRCDKCGKGYMQPIGNIVLATYPLQYPHECSECGHREDYTVKYPYSSYERVIVPRNRTNYVPE